MKLVVAIIFALVCSTIAEDVVKACADTKHFWDGSKCAACPDGCLACVGKGGKASCLDCGANNGKYLSIDSDIGSCKECAKDCKACRGAAITDCYSAGPDNSISPTAIVKCTGITGCQYCKEADKCEKCAVGYQLKDAKCTPCTSKTCLECTADVAKCTKCAYWNKLDKDDCTVCDTGCKDCPCTGCNAGYNFKDNKCTACTAGFYCTDCAADVAKCTKCIGPNYLKDDKCNKCTDANCAECSGADQCSKCMPRTAIKDSKTCVECPASCETCDADKKCSKCDANFYINTDKGCTACGAGCDGCNADGTCAKCQPGTFLETDKKTCKKCTDNCKECADASKCKTCLDTAVIKEGTCKDIPSSCTFGQMMKDDQTCVIGTIQDCGFGNGALGLCASCAPGFYAKDKTCAACPNGCKACSNNGGYVKCNDKGQDGFSFVNDTSNKADKSGYLGKDKTYTLTYSNTDEKCMPNAWLASFTKSANHKCTAYDACPRIRGQQGAFYCEIEGSAVKMTLSIFAVVVATLFTL